MLVPAGARDTIDGPGVHESSATDAIGRHIFSGLPRGQYSVDASLEGYVTLDHLKPVRVHSKGCAEVPLPLQLDRTESGRILTEDGRLAAGVTIETVSIRTGMKTTFPCQPNRDLAPPHPNVAESVRWFYPGAEDPTTAGILHVSEKAEVLRFDLTLRVPPRDRVIQGAVI